MMVFVRFFHRMEAAPQPACECRTRPPLIHGWEGTAILNHGSLVRFGCVPYMFAIVDRWLAVTRIFYARYVGCCSENYCAYVFRWQRHRVGVDAFGRLDDCLVAVKKTHAQTATNCVGKHNLIACNLPRSPIPTPPKSPILLMKYNIVKASGSVFDCACKVNRRLAGAGFILSFCASECMVPTYGSHASYICYSVCLCFLYRKLSYFIRLYMEI